MRAKKGLSNYWEKREGKRKGEGKGEGGGVSAERKYVYMQTSILLSREKKMEKNGGNFTTTAQRPLWGDVRVGFGVFVTFLSSGHREMGYNLIHGGLT